MVLFIVHHWFHLVPLFPQWTESRPLCTWWRHQMETFSALLVMCAGNYPVPGEFPAQRPVTRSFDLFFDLRPNKLLSKQPWGWWFETPSRPLWRHRNVVHNTREIHLIFSHLINQLQKVCSMMSFHKNSQFNFLPNLLYFRLLDPLYDPCLCWWPWLISPPMTLTLDCVCFSRNGGYLRLLCNQPGLVDAMLRKISDVR